MRKTISFCLIFFFTFLSNSFANLQFKQSKDISEDTSRLRGIFIKPDGTRLYVTEDRDPGAQNVIEYTLTTPFDVTTASNPKKTLLAVTEGGIVSVIDNPHAIELSLMGQRCILFEVIVVLEFQSNNLHFLHPGIRQLYLGLLLKI